MSSRAILIAKGISEIKFKEPKPQYAIVLVVGNPLFVNPK
jgi:hypothetical protein